MIFVLNTRRDRMGSLLMCILYQFFYCHKNNYYLKYNINDINYNSSPFVKSIFKLIDDHNSNLTCDNILINDVVNIPGHGGTDLCYGMGKTIQVIEHDFISYFKKHFYENIKEYFNQITNYDIPFDVENSIIIHLRLDDQSHESDYDGRICSDHFIDLINNSQNCYFTNGPNNKFNKQNPMTSDKIKKQLDILQEEFPNTKVIVISSPLTQIPEMNFNYDMVIQSNDFNYDLFLLSKSKKIILSRSNYCLISLFFGEQTHVHIPLWGHFACAGLGTKYDNCKFTYFY